MLSFKEMNIRPTSTALTGDKIKISKVLNLPIIVKAYRVVDSKFAPKSPNDYNKCLHLQIEVNDREHVVFCASKILVDLIEQVKEKYSFPFATTIVQDGEAYVFT